MTGSQDKIIRAYTPDSSQPVYQLEGHTDTGMSRQDFALVSVLNLSYFVNNNLCLLIIGFVVCSMASGKFSLISGSWDSTAKVWIDKSCVMTLKGKSDKACP